MDFEAYKQRLKQYISDQLAQLGSFDSLARAIAAKSDSDRPLSRETLRNWSNGLINEPMRPRSLEQLAAYRGETVEQTRAWLEGQEETVKPPKPLSDLMALAPLPEVVRAIAVGIERLQNTPISGIALYRDLEILKIAYQSLSEDLSAAMCSRVLRRIIQKEINPNNPVEVERLKNAAGDALNANTLDLARLNAILRGETVDCDDALIALISFALYNLTGKEEYSVDRLREEIKNAPDRVDQERSCFMD